MADFGVTPAGFIRKRLADIRPEIISALRNNLQGAGLSGDIETRPDSVMGILIDTFAEREAALWELAEGVYGAMYPISASGVSLDNAVSFTGVQREGATESRGYVLLSGAPGTVIAAGSRIRNVATKELWELASQASISTSSAGAARLLVPADAVAGEQFVIRIDGGIYTWSAPPSGATAQVVATGLASAASGAPVAVLADGARVLAATAAGSAFVLAHSSNLVLEALSSPAIAQTIEPSTLGAEAGVLTEIVDAAAGWDAVTNPEPAVAGSPPESDSDLRNRYATGMFALGGATLDAIASTIKARAPGVTKVVGFENVGNYPDMVGRPPHSVHMVVDGGLDREVAQAIYDSKAAGIDTFGDTTVAVQNYIGVPTLINFDRPVPIYIWIKASVSLLSASEQPFPDNGFEDIKRALVEMGQQLEIGDDVIWQSFFKAVYGVSGVAYANLLFAPSLDPDSPPASGAFKAANIPISDRQKAAFSAQRVEVNNGS
jgi:uncharacterized phage protein gp47/JayE